MQPRIYTYKVTFEEIPHWYWGAHKESKYGELYLGSPSTHAWMWEVYTPVLQILEIFSCNEDGWKKAQEVENRCIKPDLNNPLCLNEHYGSVISLSSCSEGGKKGDGRPGAEALHLKKDPNGKSIQGLKNARKLNEVMTPQQKTERSKRAANSTNSQKWKSAVDGFTGRACSVALHNKANGWDPAARVKISDGFTN
jgi:hypothetical protein